MTKSKKATAGVTAAILLAGAVAETAHATVMPFTPGDLVVTRAIGGNLDLSTPPVPGSTVPVFSSVALAGGGVCATVELDEYKPDGSFVQAIQLPNVRQTSTAAGTSYALTFSGTQNTEGSIQISGDGKYFTIGGYNQTAGTDAANGTITGGSNGAMSTAIQRVVGMISMNGTVNTTTGLQDVGSMQPIRSVYTTDGTNIWVGGSNGSVVTINNIANITTQGLHYATIGSTTSTQISLGTTNNREISAFDFGGGPQLLLANNSGASQTANATTGVLTTTFRGVGTVGTGMPTTGNASPVTLTPVQLAGFAASPQGTAQKSDNYWFKDANTLYIADEDTGSFGGVQKWTFQDTNADTVPDAWVFNYNVTLPVGTTSLAVGAHGLSGNVDAQGNVDLFATTFDTGANSNSVYSIVDPATPNATPSFNTPTLLATSAVNSAFRGVAIVPNSIIAQLLGDANNDGKVDLTDLNIVLNNFGKTSSLRADGNFDGGPTINLTDLADVLNNFGKGTAAAVGSVAAVPEPTSLALLGLGVAGALMRRRRA